MLLVIDSRYIDEATIVLRDVQRMSTPDNRKKVEKVINCLNRESIDLTQSVIRGMRDIKESY